MVTENKQKLIDISLLAGLAIIAILITTFVFYNSPAVPDGEQPPILQMFGTPARSGEGVEDVFERPIDAPNTPNEQT